MADGKYATALKALEDGNINLLSDTIKVVLIDTGLYTVNLATHQYLSDIASGARIAISPALSGKSDTDGVFDAIDVTLTSVAGGSTVGAIAVFQDSGSPASSRLIMYTETAGGLPYATNGGDITVQWDNGASRIFAIG